MSITEETALEEAQAENLRIPPHFITLVISATSSLWTDETELVQSTHEPCLMIFTTTLHDLERWCVSCIWRAASVILRRLIMPPLPHIPALLTSEASDIQKRTRVKRAVRQSDARRPPSSEHISEEPKVECVVLHEPDCDPTMDIIFVHGLYGSLANTWRQGDWRSKYKIDPRIIPLRKHPVAPCACDDKDSSKDVANKVITYYSDRKDYFNNENNSLENIKYDNDNQNYNINKGIFFDEVISEDKIFDENFAKTLMNQVKIVENYGTENFVENILIQNIRSEDYLTKDEDFTTKIDLGDRKEEDDLKKICECAFEGDKNCVDGCGCICNGCYSSCWPKDWLRIDHPTCRIISINYTSDPYLWRPIWVKESKRLQLPDRAEQMTEQLLGLGVGHKPIVWVGHSKGGLFIKQIYSEAYDAHLRLKNCADANDPELVTDIRRRACLWHRSLGFMFYSVPHRGSPLADLNIPPITARSIELLEIRKDCSTVLDLQERWLEATKESKPVVRSLVETCRTLMAVLWLRIVSEESADAGIGELCGVSVDHREICKPSSRTCLLYTELLDLINDALTKCQCDQS